jgi:hypothetical protein
MEYSTRFKTLIIDILKREGGYVNNPSDRGGATNKGITQQVYDTFRIKNKLLKQTVKLISMDETLEIYYREYYSPLSLDAVKEESSADILFDLAVNSGVGKAKSFETKYGYDAITLLTARNNLYTQICKKKSSQKKFLKGWQNRLIGIAKKYNIKWSV